MPTNINTSDELVEGETYEAVYLIEVKDWVPTPDLVARLTGTATGLQAELDALMPGSNEVDITNKELVKVDDRKYHYVITYKVINIDPTEPLTHGAYSRLLLWAILAIVGLLVVSVTLVQIRKTAKQTPLALLGIGYIILKALETRRETAG